MTTQQLISKACKRVDSYVVRGLISEHARASNVIHEIYELADNIDDADTARNEFVESIT